MPKNVLAIIKVLPEDVDTDLDALAGEIERAMPENCTIEKKETEPIAFGLKALKIRVKAPADLGGTDPIEEAIQALDGVQRVETLMVSLTDT